MFYVETYLKINIALFIHCSAFYRYCRLFHSFLFSLVLLITVDGNERTPTTPLPLPQSSSLYPPCPHQSRDLRRREQRWWPILDPSRRHRQTGCRGKFSLRNHINGIIRMLHCIQAELTGPFYSYSSIVVGWKLSWSQAVPPAWAGDWCTNTAGWTWPWLRWPAPTI